MTATVPVMKPREVKAEILAIRKAATEVMSSRASATRFLASIRTPDAQSRPQRPRPR